MSDPLRNFLDKTKPNFQKDGAWSKYFPLFDVFENLFYSSSRKTSGITHVRDGSHSESHGNCMDGNFSNNVFWNV